MKYLSIKYHRDRIKYKKTWMAKMKIKKKQNYTQETFCKWEQNKIIQTSFCLLSYLFIMWNGKCWRQCPGIIRFHNVFAILLWNVKVDNCCSSAVTPRQQRQEKRNSGKHLTTDQQPKSLRIWSSHKELTPRKPEFCVIRMLTSGVYFKKPGS